MARRKTISTARHYAGMPESVLVGASGYSVRFLTDEEVDSCVGLTLVHQGEIGIANGLSKAALANTFIHEVIHAIHYEYGLDDLSSEEEFTNLTANGLCAFWVNNPDVFAWWSRLLKAGAK